VRDDTLLAGLQHANHEVGTIQPVREAAGSTCTWGPDATSRRGNSRLGLGQRSTPTREASLR